MTFPAPRILLPTLPICANVAKHVPSLESSVTDEKLESTPGDERASLGSDLRELAKYEADPTEDINENFCYDHDMSNILEAALKDAKTKRVKELEQCARTLSQHIQRAVVDNCGKTIIRYNWELSLCFVMYYQSICGVACWMRILYGSLTKQHHWLVFMFTF